MSEIDLREKLSIYQRQCRFGDETTVVHNTEVYTQVSLFQ